MTNQLITPESGWVSLPVNLSPVKKSGKPYTAAIFVGHVPLNDSLNWPAQIQDHLVVKAGQVGLQSEGLEAPYFSWGTGALALAELEEASVGENQLLWCRGAAFHEDAMFNKIFCVMHAAGTPGDLVFPRLNARVPMKPGIFVIFDCREPHGFLNSGAQYFDDTSYANQELTIFATLELAPEDEALYPYFGEKKRSPEPPPGHRIDNRTGTLVSIRDLKQAA